MKNLPYEQNLKQRRDLLQNYQKEMADLNDKKIIDVNRFKINQKKNKLAEERQYIERMNQKFEEEKMLQQNIKSSKANEKMLEYKQFIQKKQVIQLFIKEEKDLKRGQRNTFIEEPIFSKEKQRYLSSNPTTNQAFIPISGNPNQYQSNNIPSNSNIQGNYRSPNETPNKNEYGQSNYIQNIGFNNHNLTPQNNIYNNQPQENQDPKSHNNIYNKQPQENQDPMSHNNIYNNQPQENQDPRSHNKEMQDNYNQGPELPQELKNPDFSDPNFDYIKYDEMMQNYAKQYLMKEDERNIYENETRQSDKNSVDEISFQMKNNLNVNTPNQDPYENEKFNPNRKDPNQTGEIQSKLFIYLDNINQNQMMTNPYQNEFISNTNLEKPNYSNENQYNQIISKSENRSNISNQGGLTPQDNYSRSNIPQNYEETYTKEMQNQPDNPYQRNPNDNINYMQYNNANNYVNSNQKFSENRSQSRDPKQNNIDQSTNSINPYQYTQLNYLRNKSNNQVSSITNSNYNFEKVNNNNIRNNYNKNTFNNTQDNENNVEKIQVF